MCRPCVVRNKSVSSMLFTISWSSWYHLTFFSGLLGLYKAVTFASLSYCNWAALSTTKLLHITPPTKTDYFCRCWLWLVRRCGFCCAASVLKLFWRERWAKFVPKMSKNTECYRDVNLILCSEPKRGTRSNQRHSAYQPSALPPGQAGSQESHWNVNGTEMMFCWLVTSYP